MAAQRWTGKAFINSNVGEIDVEVYAGTYPGAVQQVRAKYGDYKQIYNLNAVGPSNGGGGSSASGGSGCLALLGLAFIVIVGGVAGGGSGSDDYTPSESTQNAPMERVQSAPAPTTPSYANDSGPCVTANFEPC